MACGPPPPPGIRKEIICGHDVILDDTNRVGLMRKFDGGLIVSKDLYSPPMHPPMQTQGGGGGSLGRGESRSGSSGGGGCFIATAAYGTPFAQEIYVLRHWRDNKLAKSQTGRHVIQAYYELSPPLAEIVAKSEILKELIRRALSPIITYLKKNT